MFLGICTAISSSMANGVKFSAIFLLAEAGHRASRRMEVEEQIGCAQVPLRDRLSYSIST